MSHTPQDSHFVHNPDISLLAAPPHKTLPIFFQALTATALFRVWPTILFFGGWSSMIVLVNRFTEAQMQFPSTMITVLGVLLGLTLSYRTSSAYDRYWEGRRLWSQIILSSRTWARLVWIHCPDTLVTEPIEDEDAKALDETRAVIEKGTLVQMALAFAVAVKHYLRGEEGIFYEDLYHLVCFIPSLNLPSGIVSGQDANNASDPKSRKVRHQGSLSSSELLNSSQSPSPTSTAGTQCPAPPHSSSHSHPTYPPIPLLPAHCPPKFRWAETFPAKYFVNSRRRQAAEGRKSMRRKMQAAREGGGVGQNVPLEVALFMSSWVSELQRRKTIDAPLTTAMLNTLLSLSEALASLERILTTPIPWSYSAHIWEITYIYCLLLPFQLEGAGFGWLTIPGTVIVAYIVIGFAEIGEEIENPFGYDKNDLNLDWFVQNVIAQELAAITARPFGEPSKWIFNAQNTSFGVPGVSSEDLQYMGVEKVRRGLAGLANRGPGKLGLEQRKQAMRDGGKGRERGMSKESEGDMSVESDARV